MEPKQEKNKHRTLIVGIGIGLAILIVVGLSLAGCTSRNKEKPSLTTTTTSENLNAESSKSSDSSLMSDTMTMEKSTPMNNSLFLEDTDNLDIPADLLSQVRKALNAGNYPRVLTLLENQSDDASTYYKGIANFIMMMENTKYSQAERLQFAQKAEQILRDVSETTRFDGLKTRATLWYAVTLQIQYRDYTTLKKAVTILDKIKNYPTSRVYNDSVYYMGNIHAKMGWYGPARYYYRQVANLNQNGDDRVYDYTDKTFYTISEASDAGLARLKAYMDGTHPDYRAIK